MAIFNSMYWTPPFLHACCSSGSIGLEASEMSVSPWQNSSKPSPVPGPSTARMAQAARDADAYVVFPLYEKVKDGELYNSAAFIDRLVGESGYELGGLFEVGAAARSKQTGAAELVTVDAYDHPVGLAARFADPT